MLKKSVLLGSSLAVALAVSGAAWAGDSKDDNYGDGWGWGNEHVYCPAKSERKCERKGGEFDYKNFGRFRIPTCSFEQKEFVKCKVGWTWYKAKVEDTTTFYWLQYKNECPSTERTEIKRCWKLGRDWQWYPAQNKDECKPCLEDDDDNGDYGDKDK